MKVAVIGNALLDINSKSHQSIYLEDSNPGTTQIHIGGVGKNIAETLARLNEKVKLVTTIGNDYYANKILETSKSVGIDTSFVYQTEGTTPSYTSIFDHEGELVVGISDLNTSNILPPNLQLAIDQSQILVIASNLSTEDTHSIIINNQDKIIVVDPISKNKCMKYMDVLSYVHSLKCNIHEAEVMSNIKYTNLEDVPKMANNILKQGVKQVFITLGQHGSYYSNGIENGFVAALESKVVNVSGAGDAFTSGIVFGIIQNFNLQETVSFATFLSKTSLESEAPVNPELLQDVVDYIKRK